jgi:Mce-associated membrane protein
VTKTRTADPKAEEAEVRPEESEARAQEPEPEAPGVGPEDGEGAAPARSRRLGGDPMVRVALVVTLVAAVTAAWFGHSYRSASGDDSLAYAAERDRVLAAADQAIVNLNTLDYRRIDAGLKVWQDSATAELYDEIAKGGSRLRTEVEKAKTTSSARILESALTELDTRAGKAAVIAAVRVTITGAGGQPADGTRRFAGRLTRTSAGWKLSALGQAPTGTS